MPVPGISRRNFATMLSGLAAMLGVKSASGAGIGAQSGIDSSGYSNTGTATIEPLKLLTSKDLEASLVAGYWQWMRNSAPFRNANDLRFHTACILSSQWELLNAGKYRPDFELCAARGDRRVVTIHSADFRSDMTHFGAIIVPRSAGEGYDQMDPNLGWPWTPYTPYTYRYPVFSFHDRTVASSVQRSHDEPRIPGQLPGQLRFNEVREGSPAERFGLGLALSLESMHRLATQQSLDAVGEVHVEIVQVQSVLQLGLWTMALQAPQGTVG